MIVASDLNGTLTTGSPILAIANWAEKNQPWLRPKLFKYSVLFSYLQVKAGLKEIDVWADRAMRKVLDLVQSPDEEMINSIMSYVVESELWPKRRERPVSLLSKYHNQGAEIIIVSAAFEPAVQEFAKKIGDERITAIGTQVFLTEKGISLAETLTTREKKLEKVMNIIGSNTLEIALGDTFADIPLLEQAHQPIAVFPDRILRQTAEIRDWQILE
jgi:phosphoserine phosphatase